MIRGHGGNIHELARELGCGPGDIIDMSSNVNPLGPPEGLVDHLRERLDAITSLPQVDAAGIIRSFAAYHGIPEDRILAGNGTTQFIYALPLALRSRRALILGPTYADYGDACAMHDVPAHFLIADEPRDFAPDIDAAARRAADADLVFICNPNNPTGAFIPADDLAGLCRSRPDALFIIDESYLPFVDDGESQTLANRDLPNAIILNSMSKIFRAPGLRIGFITGPPAIIDRIGRYALPWSVNALAQAAVAFLMENPDAQAEFIRRTRETLAAERREFASALSAMPSIRPFPSQTSFILLRLSDGLTAEGVCGGLARRRILIRDCSNFKGLSDRHIRISLKTGDINRVVLGALRDIVSTSTTLKPAPEKIRHRSASRQR